MEQEREKELLPKEAEPEEIEEKPPFEPAPKWKRIIAWILFAVVIIGVINWLISIAYPEWQQWLMEQFR